jgi:hypothetical protein
LIRSVGLKAGVPGAGEEGMGSMGLSARRPGTGTGKRNHGPTWRRHRNPRACDRPGPKRPLSAGARASSFACPDLAVSRRSWCGQMPSRPPGAVPLRPAGGGGCGGEAPRSPGMWLTGEPGPRASESGAGVRPWLGLDAHLWPTRRDSVHRRQLSAPCSWLASHARSFNPCHGLGESSPGRSSQRVQRVRTTS